MNRKKISIKKFNYFLHKWLNSRTFVTFFGYLILGSFAAEVGVGR
ncbi:MAG: hypothetical protein SFU91_10520 [Chloroherpetonaceae bacterium]|nr:hypothetical protein [Chloroherpetonaceae bacterium]